NIEPNHLMYRPRDHNGMVIDWSYAALNPKRTGDGFRIHNELYSPPEVLEKRPPLPATDIYSLGKCMVYALGGNVATGEITQDIHPWLRNLLSCFMLKSPLQRPRDAWEMHADLRRMVEE